MTQPPKAANLPRSFRSHSRQAHSFQQSKKEVKKSNRRPRTLSLQMSVETSSANVEEEKELNDDTTTVWLRIIQINDVYELESYPFFKTLVDEKSQGPDKTLVILSGDFLGPSLLSSLDKGRGMVDTMMACGITHVCFGNHETDVPMPDLAARIRESNFVWLNTNMSEIDDVLNVTTVQHDIVEVQHAKSGSTKKVALLGLLTEDPSVYRPDVFGGATIEPVIACCDEYLKGGGGGGVGGLDPSSVDLLIPVTHQRMSEDRTFSKRFGGTFFPIVLGGHDHEAFDEVCNGSRIIKVGMDAVKTAIIDITWSSTSYKNAAGTIQPPNIKVELVNTASFPPNPAVAELVKGHQRILQELEIARLFRFKEWLPPNAAEQGILFSTENNRLGPNLHGSTILTSVLRMGMKCQCALMNAGNVRAARTYPPDQEWFAWKDLKAEIPFSTELHATYLPGHVIEDLINHSRTLARQDPPLAYGGYIHTCDKIEFDEAETHTIRSIGGKAFDRNAMYMTACPSQWFEGMDNHVPLLEWAKGANLEVDSENGKPAKVVVVEVFAALLWLELGSFDEIDANSDGVLTRDEVRVRAAEFFGDQVADLVVDNVFAVADSNQKGYITPLDMMVVRFVASDALNHVVTQDELGVMQQVAAEVLDRRSSSIDVKKMVEAMYEVLDVDSSGSINREEAMNVIGQVKRRSLLM